ncbi:MAG: flagellar hook protein FlgE [Thalassobaculales bacterium]
MSVVGGLYAGISALTAQSRNFGVISDNIANVNTVGYKDFEARFSTLVVEAGLQSSYSPGGTRFNRFVDAQKQGVIQSTTSSTDLALSGNGFFVVNGTPTANPGTPYLYTRSGSFAADSEGRLRNTAGYYLQGWRTDATGAIINATNQSALESLETVDISIVEQIAQPTENVTIAANLPASAAVGDTATTTLTVFSTLGSDHLLSIQWQKATATSWVGTFGITNQTTGAFTAFGTAPYAGTAASTVTATFNTDGTLASLASAGAAATVDTNADLNVDFIDLTIAAGTLDVPAGPTTTGAQTIRFDFGTTGAIGTGRSNGLSHFDQAYTVRELTQDGSEPAGVVGVTITDDGVVTANFANGRSRPIYQLPIATFPSPYNLTAVDGNAWAQSSASGGFTLKVAGTAGAGSIVAEALENSTVDIAQEFADLIVAQRAYSAATRIVTTGDEMLDEAIRMKR